MLKQPLACLLPALCVAFIGLKTARGQEASRLTPSGVKVQTTTQTQYTTYLDPRSCVLFETSSEQWTESHLVAECFVKLDTSSLTQISPLWERASSVRTCEALDKDMSAYFGRNGDQRGDIAPFLLPGVTVAEPRRQEVVVYAYSPPPNVAADVEQLRRGADLEITLGLDAGSLARASPHGFDGVSYYQKRIRQDGVTVRFGVCNTE